jgi:hypothetical protein
MARHKRPPSKPPYRILALGTDGRRSRDLRTGLRSKQGAIMLARQWSEAHPGVWVLVVDAMGRIVPGGEWNRPPSA